LIFRDVKDNLPTTDRDWYYTSRPVYPAAEINTYDPLPRPGPIIGIAYTRGVTTLTVEIQWKNYNAFPVWGHFQINGARLMAPTNPPPPPPDPPADWTTRDHWEYLSLSVDPTPIAVSFGANGGTDTVTFTISGLPEHVACGVLQVNYNLNLTEGLFQYDNGTKGWGPWEWIYILDSVPTGVQAVPWADFLNYTCRWAWGAVGAEDLKTKLTFGMHYSNRSPAHRLGYAPNEPAVFHPSTYGNVWLKAFTTALDFSTHVFMPCEDFAAILAVAFMTHGQARYVSDIQRLHEEQLTGFYTNEICLAGLDSTDSANYFHRGFVYHQIAASGASRFDSSSSYKYNLSGNVHMNPVPGWAMPSYWQTWLNNMVFGLAYGLPGPPAPPAPSDYHETPIELSIFPPN
jgi:hypothetical protein